MVIYAFSTIYLFLFSDFDNGLLPGVFPYYDAKFSSARGQIEAVHTKVTNASWTLLAGLLVLACLIYLTGAMAQLKVNPTDVILKGALICGLLVGYNHIFGTIMITGSWIGEQIASRQEMTTATNDLKKDADAINSATPPDNSNPGVAMIRTLGQVLYLTNGGGALTALVVGLAIIFMFISSLFINTLWVIFVVALYVFGPVSIVMLMIPGIGSKMATTWIGALIQLSAWQIWMAICWFFVKVGGTLFLVSDGGHVPVIGDLKGTVTSFESAAFAIVFALLYLGTPFIVQGMIPLSSFSAMAGIAGTFAEQKIMGAAAHGGMGGSGSGKSSESSGSAPEPGGGREAAPAPAGGGGGGGGGAAAAGGGGAGGAEAAAVVLV